MQVDILSDGVRLYDDACFGGGIDNDFLGFVNTIVGGHCFSMFRLVARTILEVSEGSFTEAPLEVCAGSAAVLQQRGGFCDYRLQVRVIGRIDGVVVNVGVDADTVFARATIELWSVH